MLVIRELLRILECFISGNKLYFDWKIMVLCIDYKFYVLLLM